MPRSYCTRDDSPMLGASLQLMSEPGSSSCREGWTMGRTKASSGLSTEEYGLILRHFEEHGPEKVEEEMCIPHKEDKLPQEPVLCGQPEPQSSVLYPWLPCARTARTRTHVLHTLSGSTVQSPAPLCVLIRARVSMTRLSPISFLSLSDSFLLPAS